MAWEAPGYGAWGRGSPGPWGGQNGQRGSCSPTWLGQALTFRNKAACRWGGKAPKAWGWMCLSHQGDPGRPPLGCDERSLHSLSTKCLQGALPALPGDHPP